MGPGRRVKRLEGELVYLRPLADRDMDLILTWRAEAEVRKQLFSARPPTRVEHEAWLADLQQRGDREEFVIIVLGSDQAVGTIGLSRIDRTRGEAEYGILIGEPGWRGRGVARDASEVILRYAFSDLGLARVYLSLFADNAPALGLYQKLGFSAQPNLAGEYTKDGRRRPTVTMQLTREVWQAHG